MCGLAGLITAEARNARSDLWAASLKLQSRGPDDRGFLQWSRSAPVATARDPRNFDSNVAFVHRRLSIIDLTEGGWQPMSTADGRHHLVFNGEIYNYLELRDELSSRGCAFGSLCDTEVLLQALVMWGVSAVKRLVGMFAFAFLDTARQEVILGRDPFGIKPLFISRWPGGLAFASEVNALLKIHKHRPAIAPGPLHDYLRYGVIDHATDTFFEGIEHVPPGHVVRVSVERPQEACIERYWAPPAYEPRPVPFDEAVSAVREEFLRSIELHLRSDVPVGVALSGGIDSSAIACAIRALSGPSVDLVTFSYLAGEHEIDEEQWIDVVAAATAARQHKIRVQPGDLVRDLDALIVAQGEPFGSTSIYAQYRVFELAGQVGVKVMLDGQGADELLAGYRPYLGARVASLLRAGKPLDGLRFVRAAGRLPGGGMGWKTAARGLAGVLPEHAADGVRRGAARIGAPRWLNRGWFAERGVTSGPFAGAPKRLSDALRDAVERTSLPVLLRYEDRNSMAHSVESRVPFLTVDFANLVLDLPDEHLLARDATSKAVFRVAMRGIVPDAVLDRRDKVGFATPERVWLQSMRHWVDEVLRSDAARRLPFLHLSEVTRHADLVFSGKAAFDWTVWRWLNVIRWADLYAVDS